MGSCASPTAPARSCSWITPGTRRLSWTARAGSCCLSTGVRRGARGVELHPRVRGDHLDADAARRVRLPRAHVAVSRRRARVRGPGQSPLGGEPGASPRESGGRPQPHLRRPPLARGQALPSTTASSSSRRGCAAPATRPRPRPAPGLLPAGGQASECTESTSRSPSTTRRALDSRRTARRPRQPSSRTRPSFNRAIAQETAWAMLNASPPSTSSTGYAAPRLRVHRPSGVARAPRSSSHVSATRSGSKVRVHVDSHIELDRHYGLRPPPPGRTLSSSPGTTAHTVELDCDRGQAASPPTRRIPPAWAPDTTRRLEHMHSSPTRRFASTMAPPSASTSSWAESHRASHPPSARIGGRQVLAPVPSLTTPAATASPHCPCASPGSCTTSPSPAATAATPSSSPPSPKPTSSSSTTSDSPSSTPTTAATSSELLEDRYASRSTLVTSQLPLAQWQTARRPHPRRRHPRPTRPQRLQAPTQGRLQAKTSLRLDPCRSLHGIIIAPRRFAPTGDRLAVVSELGERPFHVRAGLNAAVFDAVMTAFSNNLDSIPKDVKNRYESLVRDERFERNTRSSTTNIDVVQGRLRQAARQLFDA